MLQQDKTILLNRIELVVGSVSYGLWGYLSWQGFIGLAVRYANPLHSQSENVEKALVHAEVVSGDDAPPIIHTPVRARDTAT